MQVRFEYIALVHDKCVQLFVSYPPRTIFGSAMADDVAYPPCPSNEVVVYTSKGNLAHRLSKLGTEKAYEWLTPDQKVLRQLAYNCWRMFPDIKYGIHEPRMPHYERPEWLGGAFMYLKEEHVCMIKDVLQRTWSPLYNNFL